MSVNVKIKAGSCRVLFTLGNQARHNPRMMKRLTLFLIAVGMLAGCSPDGTLFEANPASPSAKIAAARDPFAGLDEQGHAEGIGSAEICHAFLQIFARRLAVALSDQEARDAFLQGIAQAEKQEANIADLLADRPALLAQMVSGFLKDVDGQGLSGGRLLDIIKGYDDQSAFLSVSEALFGLEIRLVDGPGSYQGNSALAVFHNPITDEEDTHVYEGFDPDGQPITMPFGDDFDPGATFIYLAQDEDFFTKPQNFVAQAQIAPQPTLLSSLSPVFAWLVKPAWAHGDNGHDPPPCYHRDGLYLSRFYFTAKYTTVKWVDIVVRV